MPEHLNWIDDRTFSFRIFWYTAEFMVPLITASLPGPEAAKQPQTITQPPPYFTVDVSQCPSGGPLACEHYCKPMHGSFRCFCARGYTLHHDGRSCTPQVQNPCGNLQIASEKSATLNKDINKLGDKLCSQRQCPWQVTFVDDGGHEVCHGVILGKRSVLTTAACMINDKNLYMLFAGHRNEKRNASHATKCTLHKYTQGKPDDDLAFLELNEPIILGLDTIALCLPEKDYSENILMKTGREGVLVGSTNRPLYLSLEDCHGTLNLTFSLTNKMFCMEDQGPSTGTRQWSQQRRVQCDLKSGTPVATVEGNTAFLTGLSLSENDCNQGLVFTKVSRYLHWIRQLVLRAEPELR
ncbi:protein Z, vitamin K-dependent plasma glycoprotein b isoform X3 [Hoplias malabaricus]|uniref:protein Z, vitamin K-dependent plasma glycoprotein b isoform X3 n=1 Tax=Hoplias malabaricus TaxID=27720 RepID=UPI003461BD77